MALRRLRKFARQGNDLELDMDKPLNQLQKMLDFLIFIWFLKDQIL